MRRGSMSRPATLVRVETEIGYYVVPAWVTEGIRPGIVACSHHMGRWKLTGRGPKTVDGDREARPQTELSGA